MTRSDTEVRDRGDLLLREAGPEDAPAVAELVLAARKAAVPSIPAPVHSDAEVLAFYDGLVREHRREVWVAERGEELLGVMALHDDWIDDLYVGPGHTGQGVGQALLGLAKALRPQGFGLWVFRSNADARRFYERHGLVEEERTDGSDNEEGAPDVRMSWPGTVAALRQRIDEVDATLARLLSERAALTARIQRLKPVGGHAGRDRAREAEIVARMAQLAPNLKERHLASIMEAVITASLDAAAEASPRLR